MSSEDWHQIDQVGWQKQVAILQETPIDKDILGWLAQTKNQLVMTDLMMSQRSKVVITACQFVEKLFQNHGAALLAFSGLLVSLDCLIKLLRSGNKVIVGATNSLIISILSATKGLKKRLPYLHHLQIEFGQTKNCYVREQISMYLLTLVEAGEIIPGLKDIIRNGQKDARMIVRHNIARIKACYENEQNIGNQSCNSKKPDLRKERYQLADISYHISNSILDSFRIDRPEAGRSIKDILDQFIVKQSLEQKWEVRAERIGQFLGFMSQNIEEMSVDDFPAALGSLLQLLAQKRNIFSSQSCKLLISLLSCYASLRAQATAIFLLQNWLQLSKSIQENLTDTLSLLTYLLDFDLGTYICRISQLSNEIKTEANKLLVLDSLINKVGNAVVPSSKISMVLKMLCLHFEGKTTKQVKLAAFGLIALIQKQNPQAVLTSLLCQKAENINSILALAEQIDPALGKILEQSLSHMKTTIRKRNCQNHKNQDQTPIGIQLSKIIEGIKVSHSDVISELGVFVFENFDLLALKHYVTILNLLKHCTDKAQLLEVRVLLEEIGRLQQPIYSKALLQNLLESDNYTKPQQLQYSVVYLQILQKSMHILVDAQKQISCCESLIQSLRVLYRSSAEVKIRKIVIRILGGCPLELLQQWLNPSEMALIEAYARLIKSKAT